MATLKKNALCLLLTDTHLNAYNGSIVEEIFNEALKLCRKNKITKIIHLGDFFDTRAYLTYEVLEYAKKIYDKLNNSDVEVTFIAGNHDRPYTKKPSYLKLYIDYYKNIKFIDDIHSSSLNNDIFCYYLPNWDKCLNDKLETIKYVCDSLKDNSYKKKILFAHHQISEIPAEIQVHFDLILMGHIHDKEKCTTKAHYIGSAYQQNFSEDSNKGFTILYDDLSIKLIKSKFKEFIVHKVDVNSFTEDEIKNFIHNLHSKYSNKFLRIIFEGKNKDVIVLKEFCKNLGIDVISKVTNNTISNFDYNEFDMAELDKQQILDYFDEFCINSNIVVDSRNIIYKSLSDGL